MSLVFQNIDPPPPSLPGECAPPKKKAGITGGTHSPGGEGVRGQYFGRQETLDCPLTVIISLRWNPLPKLTITSPSTPIHVPWAMGNPTRLRQSRPEPLCQSQLYPPSGTLDLALGIMLCYVYCWGH
jgi:hypothetical protein